VPLERLMLSPAHGFTLSRVDGHSTLREILSILPPGDEDPACRFLYGLLVLGVAVHDPPVGEPPFRVATVLRGQADQVALERMQERLVTEMVEGLGQRSPYQVLGVTHTTTREAVERAYEDVKERFSRDRILPRVRDKYRAELSLIESRLVEAYLTLTQARSAEAMGHDGSAAMPAEGMNVDGLLVRVEMDKTKTKMAIEENARVAEAYFAKAKKFAREGDFHNAIQYGKLASSYNSDDARVYVLLGDCLAKNPEARWQRLAEQNFLKAIELDPWNAEYRVDLGRFYKKRGLKLRARKQFEWALEIVPGHADAQGELRELS
jgi:hypothetical protein